MRFDKAILIFGFLTLFFKISQSQVTPIYGPSAMFDIKAQSLNLGGSETSPYTFDILTTLTPSTQVHQSPFYSIQEADMMQFEPNIDKICMISKITSIQASSFKVALQFTVSGATFYSWSSGSLFKFWYMIIGSGFPYPYISTQLSLISNPTPIPTNGMVFIQTVPTVSGTSVMTLSSSDTVYFFSLVSFQIVNQHTVQFSASVRLVINTLSSTQYQVKLTNLASQTINDLKICIFIYNKSVFMTSFFRFQSGFGSGALLASPTYFMVPFLWPTEPISPVIFGLSGFELAGFQKFGFQLEAILGFTINVQCKNMVSGSEMKIVDFGLMTLGELQCPGGYPYLDPAATNCLTSCLPNQFLSTSLSVQQCLSCHATCLTCSGSLSSQCSSCDTAQFRQLSLGSCIPKPGYFDNGVNPIAQLCDPLTCLQCSKTATNCTACYPDKYYTPNTCIKCPWPCVDCTSPTTCLSCVAGLTLSGSTCKCPTGMYPDTFRSLCTSCMIALPYCINCDSSTVCTLCDARFYIDAGQCKPCSPGCLQCTVPTTCTLCNTGQILNAGKCSCSSDSSYIDAAGTCQPCSTPMTNCLACSSSTVCTSCAVGYFVGPTSTCLKCTMGCNDCLSADVCKVCRTDLIKTVAGQCVCSSGKFLDSAGNCASCGAILSQCLTCTSATQCSTCNTGFYVAPVTGKCTICPLGCIDCLSGTQCKTCRSDLTLSSTGQCLCPSGQSLDASGICQSCSITMPQCQTCSSLTQCTECSAGFFLLTSSVCTQCPPGCISCTGPLACNQCRPDLIINSLGLCSCVTGQYLDTLGNCISCSDILYQCQSCSQALVCSQCNPGFYINPSNTCSACIPGCINCNGPNTCLTCRDGLVISSGQCFCASNQNYLDANGNCVACANGVANCQTCSSSSACTFCMAGFYMTSSSGTCSPCYPGCSVCKDSTTCSRCRSNLVTRDNQCYCPSNQDYLDSNGNCVACGNGVQNCVTCTTSTQCTQCSTGFYLNAAGTACPQCAQNCITCDLTGCLTCQPGSILFTDPTVAPPIICKLCLQIHDPNCFQCDINKCTSCLPSFYLKRATLSCQPLSSVICGDRVWIDEVQGCQDGNLIDGDGCSSQCQVQTDYQCLIQDKLPSGLSFCKYTKEFSLLLTHTTKQITSNTAHIFLNLEPSTFNQWTEELVQNLLFPLSIVDEATGTATVLPYSSIKMAFKRNSNTNELQLTIDYGQAVLENSFLKFNLQTDRTGLTALSTVSPKNGLFLRLSSQGSGMYFYNYDEQTYAFQSLLASISSAVGYLALLMMVLGCLVPAGKLIMLEALAVVQISFFTLMQFKKIPPTYYGLKSLIYSNGYNNPNLLPTVGTTIGQSTYDIFGMSLGAFSNQNISLIMFIIVPGLIGLIGSKICQYFKIGQIPSLQKNDTSNQPIIKDQNQNCQNLIKQMSVSSKSSQSSEDSSQQSSQNSSRAIKSSQQIPQNDPNKIEQKPQQNLHEQMQIKPVEQPMPTFLPQIIFQRYLYETTFYGIVATGYLAWVSFFHSLSKIEGLNFGFVGINAVFMAGYVYLFFKTQYQNVNLTEIVSKKIVDKEKFQFKKQEENQHIITKFGQFGQASQQLVPYSQNYESNTLKKFYSFFLAQRLISSIIIVFIPTLLNFTSLVFIVTYTIFIVALVLVYKNWAKFQVQRVDDKDEEKNQTQKQAQVENVKLKIDLPKEQTHTNVQTNNLKKPDTNKLPDQQLNKKQQLSLFSYLHKNYILRQTINFLVIILVQLLYLMTSIFMNSQDTYQIFTSNSFVTKLMPLAVLSLITLSIFFNLFLWIWELKSDNIRHKIWLLAAYFFPNSFLIERKVQVEEAKLQVQQNKENQKQGSTKQGQGYKTAKPEPISPSKLQEEQMVKKLNKFMQTSVLFQQPKRQSPFIGLEQKEKQVVKDSLLGLFKVQDSKKVIVPPDAKNLRSKLIDQFWDQI